MSAEILINVKPHETRVAYVDNGTLLDLKIERKTSPTMVGSVHRGHVIRVLPGMQAAFVDIGLEKAAFLYVGDIREDIDSDSYPFSDIDREDVLGSEQESDSPPTNSHHNKTPIQDMIKEGQYILVQVAKDPLGTKGARLTTHISLPGRFIVYLPTVRHLGVSRRIESEEIRENLRHMVQKINPQGGVI
ncbi:MAG: Rne/Rng family ribonuclease, partial [Proteobacteria bacterium]